MLKKLGIRYRHSPLMYFRENLRITARFSAGADTVQAMLLIILSLMLAIAGSVNAPGISERLDTWNLRVGIGVMIFVFALFGVFTPFRMWREQAERLHALETPRLELSVHPEIEGGGSGSRWAWVNVQNLSAKTIERCIARILDFECDSSNSSLPAPIPQRGHRLPWAREKVHGDEYFEVDIGPNSDHSIDVAMNASNLPQLLSIPSNPRKGEMRPDYSHYVLPKGAYEMTVEVSSLGSESFAPSRIRVRLVFKGNRELEVPEKLCD